MSIEDIRRIKLEGGIPKKKKIYTIPKVSKKRLAKMREQSNNDDALDKWFEDRRKEMTGKCVLCGGATLKNDDDSYRRSIHHLFEKRKSMFPSVATHPDNFLELCFYGNSCHSNIHAGKITWQFLRDSKEWDIIVSKFLKIYPYIHPDECRHIPKLLLDELDNHILYGIL